MTRSTQLKKSTPAYSGKPNTPKPKLPSVPSPRLPKPDVPSASPRQLDHTGVMEHTPPASGGNDLQRLADSVRKIEKKLEDLPNHIALAFAVPTVKEALRDVIQEAVSEATATLRNEIDGLRDEVNRLHLKVNEVEQYDRRLNLVIHGIEESPKENCDQLAMKFFDTKIGLKTSITDFQRVHRLGPPRTSTKPRPIIVRFANYRLRQEAFKNKRKLKNSGLLLTENLTASNMELLKFVRECKVVESCWTTDGQVLALVRGKVHPIHTNADINAIMKCNR